MTKLARILALAAVTLPAALAGGAEIDQAFDKARQFKHDQPHAPLRAIEMYVARSTNDPKLKAAVAARIAAILADAKTTHAAKVFFCGQLAFVGTDAQVPVLAKMLEDPKTADMARRALAMIPGEASLSAIRSAAGKLKGPALVGAINSLGARRDAKSVSALTKLLGDTDAQVAAASARALGMIATPETATALTAAEATSAVRDAQLRCAERLAADGHADGAEGIYRALSGAAGPTRWRVAGLSGLADVAPDKAMPAVLAALDDVNPLVRAHALRLTRRLRGANVTATLTQRLAKLSPASQVVLLDVLAERGDRAAAAAVARLIDSEAPDVRLAAIGAMGRVGDAGCVVRLAGIAAGEKGEPQQAARSSLERLSGPGVDRALLAASAEGHVTLRAEAIRVVAARRTPGATPTLLAAAADKDENVRVAALRALVVAGSGDCYTKLIGMLGAPASPATADAAERAAVAVGKRLADPAARLDPVLAAIGKAKPASKASLLRVLAAYGGAKALPPVVSAVADADTAVRDAGVRALANWPDASAFSELIKLARDARSITHRTLSLRGCVRLAGAADEAAARLKMLTQIREIATTPEAKKMLLAALGDVPDTAALELATTFLPDSKVHAEAAAAVLKIGRALVPTDTAAVQEAIRKIQASIEDKPTLDQAKALHAQTLRRRRGRASNPAALRPDKKRSEAAKKELAKRAPKGYRLACYLNAGPDTADGAKGGPTLRFVPGLRFHFGGPGPVATVAFDAQEVIFEITALDPKKTYQLGFVWLDYDHNTRVESVWALAGKPPRRVKLLAATKLPSGQAGQKPQEKTLPLPRDVTVFGTVRISFRNEGTPNTIVSEVWLWESQTDSPPPTPMKVTATAAATATASPKATAKKPVAKEPYPVNPKKKAPTRILLVTGIDYPGHKWKLTAPVLAAGLDKDPRLAVDVVEDPAFLCSPKLSDYQAVVMHWMNWKKPDPGPAGRENLRKFVHAGGGMVMVHFACGAFQAWPAFVEIAGRVWNPKMRGHDPRGKFQVRITDVDHPITRGMKPFDTFDELYTCLDGKTKILVLADAKSKVDKKLYAMAFVLQYGQGRVFHSPLGHDVKAFPEPVLELFRRGTAWSAKLTPTPEKKTGGPSETRVR